jgi:hypothetical protein
LHAKETDMLRVRLVTVCVSLLVSANAWADLRTYDVDIQYRQEVYEALRRLLVETEESARVGIATYGRVQLLPSGQILVEAQPETLVQIAEVLKAVKERPVGAAPRVSLRYWAVIGMPAGQNTPAAGGDVPPLAPVPPVLDAVLAELKRFHGDLAFRVIGTATAVTQSGQQGGVEGMPFSVHQTAIAQGETLNANIRMELAGGLLQDPRSQFNSELEVRTTVKRGEFVVLGESTLRGGGFDGTVFYIVHWPEDQ